MEARGKAARQGEAARKGSTEMEGSSSATVALPVAVCPSNRSLQVGRTLAQLEVPSAQCTKVTRHWEAESGKSLRASAHT
jgi:hypothetical protein